MRLHSAVGRASLWYRGGHGFESRWVIFFGVSFSLAVSFSVVSSLRGERKPVVVISYNCKDHLGNTKSDSVVARVFSGTWIVSPEAHVSKNERKGFLNQALWPNGWQKDITQLCVSLVRTW